MNKIIEKIGYEFNGILYSTEKEAIKEIAKFKLDCLIQEYEDNNGTLAYINSHTDKCIRFLWKAGNLAAEILNTNIVSCIVSNLKENMSNSVIDDFAKGYLEGIKDVEEKYNKTLNL